MSKICPLSTFKYQFYHDYYPFPIQLYIINIYNNKIIQFSLRGSKMSKLVFHLLDLALGGSDYMQSPSLSKLSSRMEGLKDLNDLKFCQQNSSLFVKYLQLGSIKVDKFYSPPSFGSSTKLTCLVFWRTIGVIGNSLFPS